MALSNWSLGRRYFYRACELFRLESTLFTMPFKFVVLLCFICFVDLSSSLLVESLSCLNYRYVVLRFDIGLGLVSLLCNNVFNFFNFFSFQIWLERALLEFTLVNLLYSI